MGRAASLQRERACSSWEERLDWSLPEPMNPMPPLYAIVRMLWCCESICYVPALLTSTASLGPAIIRIGAEVINGVDVHG